MKIVSIMILLIAIVALTACVVRSGPGYSSRQQSRSCPPAHHWDGYACVHNGNGHGKHKGR